MTGRQIRLRWEGNSSPRYDGVTQDVALKYVFREDLVNIEVGSIVRVKWGRRSRVWKGIVVDLLQSASPARPTVPLPELDASNIDEQSGSPRPQPAHTGVTVPRSKSKSTKRKRVSKPDGNAGNIDTTANGMLITQAM